MPTYFSRAELQAKNEELERKLTDALRQSKAADNRVTIANHEIKLLQDELIAERNRNAALSRTVFRQDREKARLQAEIDRLDEIAAPIIARKLA